MHIQIQQDMSYRYETPVNYSVQMLRLRPLGNASQKVLSWRLTVPPFASLTESRDAYGNVVQTLYIDRLHDETKLALSGEIETEDTDGVVRGTFEPFPPVFFLRQTDLTMANDAIRSLAKETGHASQGAPLELAHKLMGAVREAVDYRVGDTHAATTAAEALALGYGVCQDHTHIFISAARLAGIPARYVSGYLWDGGGGDYEASHAWAEAYIDDLGWVGFDVANRICPTGAHIRVASGLDYLETAPVRGRRRGGGEETVEVHLKVDNGASQQ